MTWPWSSASLAVAAVSRAVIRSTVGSLRDALAAAATLVGRQPRRGGAGPATAGDEIAQLLASMQEMMAALAIRERQLNEAQRLAHLGSWEWDMATRRSPGRRSCTASSGAAARCPGDLDG